MLTKIQKANAKINIYLQVLNKNKDNYHNINSLFYPIPLYDEITISNSQSLELHCNNNLNINNKDNLIYKAAVIIQKYVLKNFNKTITPKIELNKNIPIGAGLGGGSSDAANTLLALNQYYELNLDLNTLHNMAISLGSDVPFFLYNKPALISGRGEIIKPIDYTINSYLLLVFPNISISTAIAYKMLNRNENYQTSLIQPSNIIKDILFNDFEETVFKMYPELYTLKIKLNKLSNNKALMSGSGSSFFAFFDTEAELHKAKAEMDILNYFTFTCKL